MIGEMFKDESLRRDIDTTMPDPSEEFRRVMMEYCEGEFEARKMTEFISSSFCTHFGRDLFRENEGKLTAEELQKMGEAILKIFSEINENIVPRTIEIIRARASAILDEITSLDNRDSKPIITMIGMIAVTELSKAWREIEEAFENRSSDEITGSQNERLSALKDRIFKEAAIVAMAIEQMDTIQQMAIVSIILQFKKNIQEEIARILKDGENYYATHPKHKKSKGGEPSRIKVAM
mgnify:FL=1